MSTPTLEARAGTLEHINPRTLILKRNIRESVPSDDLVASIKDLGVLEPITAVTSPEGLVIRFGHRRTLAAIAADLDAIPVYIVGADDLADDAEVQRVISQFDENTQRKGLTASDQVGVVEQLVAFGLTADQITKRTRVARKDVDAAITVTESKFARKAAAKWDALTLDQTAAIAEFDDDPELSKQLVVTAIESPGQFEHLIQRTRDDRASAAAIAKATEELTAQGVKVIKRPHWDDKAKPLSHLLDSAGKNLTPKAHSTCQGNVAWFEYDNPVYGCTNPKPNGHKERYPRGGVGTGKTAAADMSEAERETAKKARKLVIENNKAWDSAQVVRREFLANLAKQKTAPKGSAAHVASLVGQYYSMIDAAGRDLAYEWLGIKTNVAGAGGAIGALAAKATESRALLIALIRVLAGAEAARDHQDWRQNGKTSDAGHHLRFLESIGYELSDVEKYALSTRTGN